MDHLPPGNHPSSNPAVALVSACLQLCDREEYVSAEDLWESVVLQAFALCGENAVSELDRCGIRSPADIQRIVTGLRDAGQPLPPVDTEPDHYAPLPSVVEIIEPCLLLREDPSLSLPTLHTDVSCACGYDLRGLRPDGKCPECGIPVAIGVFSDTRFAEQVKVESVERIRCELEQVAAFRCGVPPVAVELTMAGLGRAIGLTSRGAEFWSTGPKASDVCAGILDVAIEHHGIHAVRMLERLHLVTAGNVGRVVEHLGNVGLIVSDETDSLADFHADARFADLYQTTGRGQVRGAELLGLARDWCPKR